MGYDPDLKCLKCFQRPRYVQYCEDCSGTFCTDCLITEKTDCTYCNYCSHISVGTKCEKCGRENNMPVSRKVNKCPMCASIRLKDINKKISGLPTEFYEAVEKLSLGLESINAFANKYTKVVISAKQLRRERYGLYPSIESGLMRLQKLFFETHQRANDLLEKVYDHILRDAKTIIFGRNISINQLSRTDKTISLIETHAMSYSNLIDDFLDKPNKELLAIEEKIAELKNYTFLFDETSEKFEPEAYELRVAAFPKIKIHFPGERRTKNGILFITNRKLYFLPEIKFIFKFLGRIKIVDITTIRDIEIKNRKLLGDKMLLNLPEKNRIKIKTTNTILDKISSIFNNLFDEHEGYIINDPYMMESFPINLNYNMLQDRIEQRINDLKQAPYRNITQPHLGSIITNPAPAPPVPRETEEMRTLRIELQAARDTLRELIKAFNDRSISPEVYFARREKTKQRILALEEELDDAKKSNNDQGRLLDLFRYYSGGGNQPGNYSRR